MEKTTLALPWKGRGQEIVSHFSQHCAFTIAEVLITLAVIGVVAALTIPTLVQGYKKQVVETRLQKFYSTMKQAVELSKIDNGETRTWELATEDTADEKEKFWNTYFAPYVSVLKTEKIGNDKFFIYFKDGSAVRLNLRETDWQYCINPRDLDKGKIDTLGTKCFYFGFYPRSRDTSLIITNYYNKGVEPYVSVFIRDIKNGTYIQDEGGNDLFLTQELIKSYLEIEPALATKVIQLNSWKIPKDYPFRF